MGRNRLDRRQEVHTNPVVKSASRDHACLRRAHTVHQIILPCGAFVRWNNDLVPFPIILDRREFGTQLNRRFSLCEDTVYLRFARSRERRCAPQKINEY